MSDIDTARFLLGDLSPERVTASIGNGRYGHDDDDDVGGDNDGIVLIDWSNGVRSSVEFG